MKKNSSGIITIITHLTLILACLGAVLVGGCEQPNQKQETYNKKIVAWPLFDLEKTEGVNEDGTTWRKEKGDQICWLITWEKEKTYDKDGFVIYRKEKSAFFPLYSDEEEESAEFRIHKGMVLVFPFYSKRDKTVEVANP